MRFSHMLLRSGIIIVLASLTIACNDILGVEDVFSGCYIQSEYPKIVEDASTRLIQSPKGAGTESALTFRLDANVEFRLDANIELKLSFKDAQRDVLPLGVPYMLTTDDSNSTCYVCVVISADLMMPTGNMHQDFWARAQGYLVFIEADNVRLQGSMHELVFRQVRANSNGMSTEVADGCPDVTIDEVVFNHEY